MTAPISLSFESHQQDTRETIELIKINHRDVPCLRHTHDFIELVYVDRGLGAHYIGNVQYEVAKGDICLINTDTPHRFESTENNELEIINCLIDPDFLSREFPDSADGQSPMYQLFSSFIIDKIYQAGADMRLKGRDTREVKRLLSLMCDEYAAKEPGYIEVIEGYMKALLYIILRLFSGSDATHQRSVTDLIHSVKRYVMSHSFQKVKVEEIARLFFVKAKYLSRVFKRETGETIISYLQSVRIEDAMKLLAETDYPVRDISLEIGYNDVSFFYQVFRRQTGQTPGEYRQRLRP